MNPLVRFLGFLFVALAFATRAEEPNGALPVKDQVVTNVTVTSAPASNQVSVINTNPPTGATNAASATNDDVIAPEFYARSVRGQRAPKFEIEKWLTAPPSMQGKFVLIDFWATWCVGCRQSIPELNGFSNKFKDRLVIVGITDETEEDIRKTTLPPMEYSVAIDTDERMVHALDIQALPHSILVDPSGIVRYEGSPLFLNDEKLRHLLDKYSK